MVDKAKLGRHIALLRKQKGMSQKELSSKLNISFQAISKWERGLSLPDIEMLSKISKVFGTSLGYFLFEVSSSMNIDELLESVNNNGINEKNYKSVGALVQSDIFSKSIINKFDDENIKNILNDFLLNQDNFRNDSLIKISHKVYKEYASLLDMSNLNLNKEKINEITVYKSKIELDISYILISKFLARITDAHEKTVVFLINIENEKVYFVSRCSNDLIDRGFNCHYITQLISQAVIRPSIVSGSSGGGAEGHSSFSLDSTYLRDDYLEQSKSIFEKYVLLFEEQFVIDLC